LSNIEATAARLPEVLRKMTQLLRDRVALVTGASSGIGAAVAVALAAAGAHVVAAARRADRLQRLVTGIEANSGSAEAITLDVSRQESACAAIDAMGREHKHLDILVNSAGVMLLGSVADADPSEWRQMLEVNLLGLMQVTKTALTYMQRSHIVNIASLAGRVANANASGYAASKFGVVAFSESLRREVCAQGIRVTVIEPGMVATELGEHITNQRAREGLKERLQQAEPLQADDIAAAVLYAVTQPPRVNVNEILLRPTLQER